MIDINGLIVSLSQRRPLFHSEADFQHMLAWRIHEVIPDCEVRLEFPFQIQSGRRRRYLDIWLPSEGIAVELKYYTRRLELDVNGELFAIRDQFAQDLGRYDFIKDIQRLEQMATDWDTFKAGFAILLTNDRLYWRPPLRDGTVDEAFRLHEGVEKSGQMAWADHAGAGTTRGRESTIQLTGTYGLHWQDYSNVRGEKYGEFRYLAVSVE